MPIPDPERWKVVSSYLDQALDLGTDERSAWLADLRQRDPSLAAEIESLLEKHQALARRGFLEAGIPLPVDAAPECQTTGQTLGPYTLFSPIGSGGMGTVWLAERTDGRFERRVA